MLSARLVQLIEDHWEGVTLGIIREIRTDPKLNEIRRLADAELLEIGRTILKNLGQCLTASAREQGLIEEQYEGIGRMRFAEAIPLHECVRALQLVKHRVVAFLREHEFARSTLDIYAEEEMEHRLNRFFDDLIYHEVIGYETALRQAARMSA